MNLYQQKLLYTNSREFHCMQFFFSYILERRKSSMKSIRPRIRDRDGAAGLI